jgi:hypothetical protein
VTRHELGLTGLETKALWPNLEPGQLSDRLVDEDVPQSHDDVQRPDGESRGIVGVATEVFELIHREHEVGIRYEVFWDVTRLYMWVIHELWKVPSQPVMV